jgi:signal transduction histidine kinase
MPEPSPLRSVKCVFRRPKRYQLVVDVVAAMLFAAIVAWPEFQAGRMVSRNPLGTTLVVVLMAVALALRRLSPGIGLGVAWCGATVQMVLGRPPSLTDGAIFAVLYTTAAYGSRVVFWLGFASALTGAGVATVYLFAEPILRREQPSVITAAASSLSAAMLALLLAWTVGALVRAALSGQENRLAQQRAEAEAVAEQERLRIARDMHDVVAHSLAVVVAQADGARYAATSDPSVGTEALSTIATTARGALSDVRLLLAHLRRSQGDDAPQPTLADLEELYGQLRAAGADLRVDVAPAPQGTPSASIQLAVYRILQEACTNALRHGGAGPVDVHLAWHADCVDLEVRSSLRAGASVAQLQERANLRGGERTRGHGIIGMRERAQLVGGRLEVLAHDGVFVVRANIPTERMP